MKAVFADAACWLTLANPKDELHDVAKEARRNLGNVHLVTTDETLMEFLTGLSKFGAGFRRSAARAVREIMNNPNVKVVPQTRSSFIRGLELYESRLDKRYSMQDCISFIVMDEEGITEVLTSDHHFAREGFIVLMSARTP